MTTVGYGDRFPTTGEGRLVGAGLMLGGIALLGVVSASLAWWFVERLGSVEQQEAATSEELAAIRAELAALRAALSTGQPGDARGH